MCFELGSLLKFCIQRVEFSSLETKLTSHFQSSSILQLP